MDEMDDWILYNAVEDSLQDTPESSPCRTGYSRPAGPEERPSEPGLNGTADSFAFSARSIERMVQAKKTHRMSQMQESLGGPLFLCTLLVILLSVCIVQLCGRESIWSIVLWPLTAVLQLYSAMQYPCAIRRKKTYTDRGLSLLAFRNRLFALLGNIFFTLPVWYVYCNPSFRTLFFDDTKVDILFLLLFLAPWIVYLARFRSASRTHLLLRLADSIRLLRNPEDDRLREREKSLDGQIRSARNRDDLPRLQQERMECITQRYTSYLRK